ncbi:uncharacterized protein E0L32_011152 [Thyridium curvatum]|uniref:Palmitoyltransferase n=1 Tax=Thyridium curvatum TaxID=1093900 RepID=A0A507AQ00_9PEZI|nr:uncharacterized protein E0L32_011152 [Thyridium curvatum]TPX06928.1 hypothetical protein E0L32_011152 [Thyridium curvatum]
MSLAVRRWARRVERYCCTALTYFPLAFVYTLTTWACWVAVTIGTVTTNSAWIGHTTSLGAVLLYALLNWSYTTAVFTPPGSTTNDYGYSTLPTHAPPSATTTSLTVKSNGELRFCKKCQARKPDRAHHCSTCRRCVLKMDHHCPWLASCIGLRNHKAFLLFLVYTSLFCWYTFAISATWVWTEILNNTTYVDTLMPVNFIVLSVVSGIIGLVVSAFTGWHILLATRGQTTIECLEKTRYLSPLRKTLHNTYNAHHGANGVPLPGYGQQLLDMHQNMVPGVTRPEEGEDADSRSITPLPYSAPSRNGPTQTGALSAEDQMGRRFTYDELERYRARKRYEEYLDEQDSQKLPHAFDLGPRRNLLHLFGHNPWLWPFPFSTTTGDGWSWEPNPKWIDARERIRRERDEQRQREQAAGWGMPDDGSPLPSPGSVQWLTDHVRPPPQHQGAGRHYLQPDASLPSPAPSSAGRRTPSKADCILGRDPNLYADEQPVSMKRLSPATGRALYGDDDLEDDDDGDLHDAKEVDGLVSRADDDDAERRALNLVTNGGWDRRAGASGLLRKGSVSPTKGLGGSASNGHGHDEGVD